MSAFEGLADVFAGVFGEPVIYNGGEIVGIWIDPPVIVPMPLGVSVASTRTELHVRASDFPMVPPAEGDTVVRGGISYRVDGPPQPDGKGMVVLNLARTS